MRPRADLKFIAARVIDEWVTNRTPILPLLGETQPAPPAEVCARGHTDWTTQHNGKRRCQTCATARQRRRRATVREGRSC